VRKRARPWLRDLSREERLACTLAGPVDTLRSYHDDLASPNNEIVTNSSRASRVDSGRKQNHALKQVLLFGRGFSRAAGQTKRHFRVGLSEVHDSGGAELDESELKTQKPSPQNTVHQKTKIRPSSPRLQHEVMSSPAGTLLLLLLEPFIGDGERTKRAETKPFFLDKVSQAGKAY
jgi:hypothetical protein